MGMFGQLRNDFFKYRRRKRKSLDGSVPGVEYNRYRRPTTRPFSSANRGGNYHQKLYLGDLPSEYHPNINAPAVQNFDYESGEAWELTINAATPDMPRPPSIDPSEMPPLLFPTAEEDLSLEERFLMNSGASPRPQEGPTPVALDEIRHLLDGIQGTIHDEETPEVDTIPRIADITDALNVLEGVLPEDHPDIVNLKSALQLLNEQETGLSPFGNMESASDFPELDPVAEAQQIFDQQFQELDKPFELPEFMQMDNQLTDGFDEQQAVLNQMLEQAQPNTPYMEQEDPFDAPEQPFAELEMMADEASMNMPDAMSEPAGFGEDMIAGEINQAIDQVSGQAMPMEPEPDPMPYDPLMMPQYMYDPYMQMDPFMMPGALGPGPMGPGFGPMPGP